MALEIQRTDEVGAWGLFWACFQMGLRGSVLPLVTCRVYASGRLVCARVGALSTDETRRSRLLASWTPPFLTSFFGLVGLSPMIGTPQRVPGRGSRLSPLRTAVPFWGKTTQISSGLSPKRDCGPKKGQERAGGIRPRFAYIISPFFNAALHRKIYRNPYLAPLK